MTEKKFEIRNSLLTDRLRFSPDVACIYNIFLVGVTLLLAQTALNDFLKDNRINVGQRLIVRAFQSSEWVVSLWIFYLVLACCTYFAFCCWARIRQRLFPKGLYIWDRTCFLCVPIWYLWTFLLMPKLIKHLQLSEVTCVILLMEQVRLLMKQHSFIRNCAPTVLKCKLKSETTRLQLPTFSSYAYFLFAPTLLYRDEYPRTKSINWRFVLQNITEICMSVLLTSLVFERFLKPAYENICIEEMSSAEFFTRVTFNLAPGTLIFLNGFYCILHLAQNLFAELLRFGDRMFYQDWWTTTNLSDYYRKWNLLVYDWLHTYIYKDMCQFVCAHRGLAKFMVFLVSNAMHEYILTYTFGFFLPILGILFFVTSIPMALFNLMNFPIGNYTLWLLLLTGTSWVVNLYAVEFSARMNCGNTQNMTDWLPAFLTCGCIN